MATDDFNRANSNSLGSPWAEDETAATVLKIASSQLVCSNTDGLGTDYGFAKRDDGLGNDQSSELEYRSHTDESGFFYPQAGPAVRCSGTRTNFTGYVALLDPGAVSLKLIKFVNASLAVWGTAQLGTTSYIPTAGDIIRVEAEGTTIRVKLNGATVITAIDSAISTGLPGVISQQGYSLG